MKIILKSRELVDTNPDSLIHVQLLYILVKAYDEIVSERFEKLPEMGRAIATVFIDKHIYKLSKQLENKKESGPNKR